jgi:hypothetical protein
MKGGYKAMEATMTFHLPEEASEYNTHFHAMDYYCSISDFLAHLRHKIRYEDTLTDEQIKLYEEIRDTFVDMLKDRNVEGDFF